MKKDAASLFQGTFLWRPVRLSIFPWSLVVCIFSFMTNVFSPLCTTSELSPFLALFYENPLSCDSACRASAPPVGPSLWPSAPGAGESLLWQGRHSCRLSADSEDLRPVPHLIVKWHLGLECPLDSSASALNAQDYTGLQPRLKGSVVPVDF